MQSPSITIQPIASMVAPFNSFTTSQLKEHYTQCFTYEREEDKPTVFTTNNALIYIESDTEDITIYTI